MKYGLKANPYIRGYCVNLFKRREIMKISVILPVYNVEGYIQACLNSLLEQSIGEENLEVILVDDCSTDNTPEKINEFKNKFTNFVYYRLPENEGSPGKPRNIGVELSTGEFIHFMDPDDILDEFAYETLLEFMDESDDFSMGKMISFNEDGSQFEHTTFREYKLNKTYKSTSLKETPFFAQVKVGVVLKLIRKSFYINNEISFIEGMRNGEDKIVDTLLYTTASSFSYIPYVIYKYRNRDTGENKSLTHQEVESSIYNDIKAYYDCKKHYDSEAIEFFKINVLRSIFWKIVDDEFDSLSNIKKMNILYSIYEIVKSYDENIVKMYLNNEEPIIKLISNKDFELAISYSALLNARRKYFYQGIEIEKKYREFKQFKKSKSYLVFKALNKLKIIK